MSAFARLRRSVRLPDPLRVARSRRAPELGPRILFFSGGTALRPLSRALKLYTHNSAHLITPFDSGGSSAVLRAAFGMLSVGDLRSRLMALADETVRGNPAVYELFSHRLSREDGVDAARQLDFMAAGSHQLVAEIPSPLRQIVCTHLRIIRDEMPENLDLCGANIGNLILAGGYLLNDRDIESVILLFSKLVEVRGIAHPVCDADLHLAAELADGTRLVGQHRLTGKESRPIESPVVELSLVRSLDTPERAEVTLPERSAALIGRADLICYPMGSFYSSLIANLLPKGVGSEIRRTDVPKIYVPNTGIDPEQLGMSGADAVGALVRYVRADAGADTPIEEILDLVLVDTARGRYATPLDPEKIERLGVQVVDLELVRDPAVGVDPELLCDVLVSLA
jgi:CofD-related protein of GAK system